MNLQGWKTYLASLMLVVLGALPKLLSDTNWDQFMVDPKTGLGLIFGGLVMAVFRKVTQDTTVQTALKTPPPDASDGSAP